MLLFFTTNGIAQNTERPFSFSLNTGVTIHADYLVNDDYSWNAIGIDYFEGGMFYKLNKNIEIGATLGRDKFKISGIREVPAPEEFVSFTSLNPYTWIAGNINYYFNDDYSAGIKAGAGSNAYYISGNFGIKLINSKDWGLYNVLQISSRIGKTSSTTSSYQINVLFNVRFKPDLSNFL